MISREDVMALGNQFWAHLKRCDPWQTTKHLFINPGILVQSGEFMSLLAHAQVHLAYRDQSHQ